MRLFKRNQAQRNQQLSDDELQRTQVLNLKDVEEVAHFEKITSKKPAIILAIIGALFLTFGTTFQIATNLSAKHKEEKVKVQKRENIEIVDEDNKSLNCEINFQNNADGTDTSFKVVYNFKNDQLINFTKTFKVTPNPTNPAGIDGVKGYVTGYQPFMISGVNGYNITVTPKEDNTEITCNVSVDLETIDLTTFPTSQQNHFSTSIDYALYTDYETIKNDLTSKNFVCE